MDLVSFVLVVLSIYIRNVRLLWLHGLERVGLERR